MPKNILVLVGSPKQNGNTEILADAFIKGATKNGNNVKKLRVGKMKISGCIDCKYCFTHDDTCSQRDDMDKIYPLVDDADMIVLATPIYFFSMNAQLKAVVDRLNAGYKSGYKISKSALLAVASGGDSMFEPLIKMYELICKYLKWESVGIITVGKVENKGDIEGRNELLLAEQLGESIK